MGVGEHIGAYPTGSAVPATCRLYEAITNRFALLNCVYPASRVSLQMGKNKYEIIIWQQN